MSSGSNLTKRDMREVETGSDHSHKGIREIVICKAYIEKFVVATVTLIKVTFRS